MKLLVCMVIGAIALGVGLIYGWVYVLVILAIALFIGGRILFY